MVVRALTVVRAQFIEVWRQKETALQTTQLTNLLLSNAGHEGIVSPSSLRVWSFADGLRGSSADAVEPYHQVSAGFGFLAGGAVR